MPKLSKYSEFSARVKQKMRQEENIFNFLREIFISAKASRFYQNSSIPTATVYASYAGERISVSTNPFIKYFIPRRTGINCPMIKQLAWYISTENFWLDVHLYKDPMGTFPFQLLSLWVGGCAEDVVPTNFWVQMSGA